VRPGNPICKPRLAAARQDFGDIFAAQSQLASDTLPDFLRRVFKSIREFFEDWQR
jgi:hypothetical protein